MNRVTLKTSIAWFFVLLLLIQGNAAASIAQEITDKDLENIRREKEFAEARKAIAEAELAESRAKYPAAKSPPLEGKTTINDGAVIESQMMAYAAMARSANQMAKALREKRAMNMTALAIYNPKDIDSLLSYRVTLTQLDLLKDEYCKVLKYAKANIASPNTCPQPAAAAIAVAAATSIASSFLGSFVDLTALLRTNVEIKGQSFDIDEISFASEVFRAVREKDAPGTTTSFYYPYMFPPDLDKTTPSELLTRLENVRKLKMFIEALVKAITENDKAIKKIESQIKELELAIVAATGEKADLDGQLVELKKIKPLGSSTKEKIAIIQARIVKLDAMLAIAGVESLHIKKGVAIAAKAVLEGTRNSLLTVNLEEPTMQDPNNLDKTILKLQLLIQQFDQFIASLIQADKVTGVNPLTTFIKAEKIDSALPTDTGYWLQLKVIKAGGNNRIKTNLLWDVFTGGNRLSHSGGVIAQYILFDKSGKVVASDVLTIYSSYIKSNKVKNLPCKDIDDQNAEKCKK